ncbi:MAG TPA: EAL domain-containing protein [Bacillota bacterium]|nr:EAL domain-containing protein [Bacillota bacterium]
MKSSWGWFYYRSSIFWKTYLCNLILLFTTLAICYESARAILPTIEQERSRMITDATVNRLADQASVITKELQHLEGLIRTNATFLSNDPNLLTVDLGNIVNYSFLIDSAAIFDKQGDLISKYPNSDNDLKNVGFRTYFSEPLHTANAYISNVIFTKSGQPALVMGVPIVNAHQQVEKIVAIRIELVGNPVIESLFEHFDFGGNGYPYIVDENGRLLFHPDKKRIAEDVHQNSVVEALLERKSGYRKVTNLQGVEMLASYRYMPYLRWGVVAQIPVENTYYPLRALKEAVGKYFLFLLLPLIFIVAFYTRRTIQPVKQLQRAVHEVTNGNYDYHISTHGKTEIGALFQRFNEMVANIRENREDLKYLAYHDSLTGLPNRVSLEKYVSQFIEQVPNQQKAMMFLDLDRFKLINDSLGHVYGDRLIQMIAKRLQDCLPENGFVARMGGDEFTILLTDIQGDWQVEEVAQIILDNLTLAFQMEKIEFHITTSIGISYYPKDGDAYEVLLKKADAAMYQAKKTGKNKFHIFEPDMERNLWERLEIEASLRKALEYKEMSLVYQPKFDLGTNKICGMEALTRWQHSIYGAIPPDKFIPIMEENGLIITIGEWILREACRQNKSWQEDGYKPLRMAVNLSVKQLLHPCFISMIDQILQDTELDPQWLELEITESTIMENAEEVVSILMALKGKGIALSIDDFGTGYSSLSYLRQLPIHTIKVDRSFIKDSSQNEESQMIIRAILSMAKSLKLKVIAEGVEEEQQIEFLRREGCDEIQGYIIGKPMNSNGFIKFLSNEDHLIINLI